MLDYERRGSLLRGLGFNSYKEYLSSFLWKRIRKQVFEEHDGECVICHQPAKEVHHLSYELNVLNGDDTSKLVAICDVCHELGEFKASGEKRTLSQTNKQLRLLSNSKSKRARKLPFEEIVKQRIKLASHQEQQRRLVDPWVDVCRRLRENRNKEAKEQRCIRAKMSIATRCDCGMVARKSGVCRKCEKLLPTEKKKTLEGYCRFCGAKACNRSARVCKRHLIPLS